MMNKVLLSAFFLILSFPVFGQIPDLVSTDGVTSPLHRANIGRITFMSKPIPLEKYREADFLKTYELRDSGDLNIRVFMDNSLTNYLHRLAPGLTAVELLKIGNYQVAFFVDSTLIYKENLNAGAGVPEAKNMSTILRVPFMTSTNEDSWGTFMWNRFMMNGGADALDGGSHLLTLEVRPYLRKPDLTVGGLIAHGEVQLRVTKPEVDEKLIAVQPIQSNSGWTISEGAYDRDKIRDLNKKIAGRVFKNITSIIVIRAGSLLVEEYFNGGSRDSLNDTRSVGKSFASALTGIAIHDGYIGNEYQTIGHWYDLRKSANYSAMKESVTIKSLLTMSSGFDADDNDNASPGNEENMYPTGDWVKFALDLPMDPKKEVGKQWAYFTAGVIVLGDILNKSVPGGLEQYADDRLFKRLDITNYRWEYTPQKVANTAGGLRLRSLDLARFGQLYLNGGSWNGTQIIPRSWVEKSFSKYLKLPFEEYGSYGYLFWNMTFKVNNKSCEAFFATGNGGNKIFIFRDQPLVVVITATAYNKGYAHPQANRMMEKYILPAVVR